MKKQNLGYAFMVALVFSLGYLIRKYNLASYFSPKAEITILEKSLLNFGEIKYGELAVHYFKFKNTGNEDLIISNIETKCGCTISDWNKEAIKPNQTDSIRVEYDTKIIGPFNRSINIYSNTEKNIEYLHIIGVVKN